jgi:hypothetical protein
LIVNIQNPVERMRRRLALRELLGRSDHFRPMTRTSQSVAARSSTGVEFKALDAVVESRGGKFYASRAGIGRWGESPQDAERNLATALRGQS